MERQQVIPYGRSTTNLTGLKSTHGITRLLSVVKAGYSRKCMFLRATLHPSIFLVVDCNGAILVSQVLVMTLLVVYNDE